MFRNVKNVLLFLNLSVGDISLQYKIVTFDRNISITSHIIYFEKIVCIGNNISYLYHNVWRMHLIT